MRQIILAKKTETGPQITLEGVMERCRLAVEAGFPLDTPLVMDVDPADLRDALYFRTPEVIANVPVEELVARLERYKVGSPMYDAAKAEIIRRGR